MDSQPHWFRDTESFGAYIATGDVIARNFYHDFEAQDGTKQRIFPRIFVHPSHRGAGLAGDLTKHSLDITIDEGFRIVPVCPYIARWVREYDNGAYLQYRDEPGSEHFNAD